MVANISFIANDETVDVNWTTPTTCTFLLYFEVKLYRDNILVQNISNIDTLSRQVFFDNIGVGTFYATVDAWAQDIDIVPLPPPFICSTSTTNTIINGSLDCIPSNLTNVKFSDLNQFYNVGRLFDLELSGPNNPSFGNSIFGKSGLPASGGPPDRTRPNAVSELRGSCIKRSPLFFGYIPILDLVSSTISNNEETNVYNVKWISSFFGETFDTPANGYELKLRISITHSDTAGTVINNSPYSMTVFKNNVQVSGGSVSRNAGSNGTQSTTVDITMNLNDTSKIELKTRLNPFGTNCGGILNYTAVGEIVEAKLNNNLIPSAGDIFEQRNLGTNACNLNTLLEYSFNALPNINGRLELYLNNVLTDTITTLDQNKKKYRFVNSSTVIRIRTLYNGDAISGYINPKISNNVTVLLPSASTSTTTSNISSGTQSFLDSSYTTPSSGFAHVIMTGSLTGQISQSLPWTRSLVNFGPKSIAEYFFSTPVTSSATQRSIRIDVHTSSPARFEIIRNNTVLLDTGYIARNTTQFTNLNNALTEMGLPTAPSISVYSATLDFPYINTYTMPGGTPYNFTLKVTAPLGFANIGYRVTLSA